MRQRPLSCCAGDLLLLYLYGFVALVISLRLTNSCFQFGIYIKLRLIYQVVSIFVGFPSKQWIAALGIGMMMKMLPPLAVALHEITD